MDDSRKIAVCGFLCGIAGLCFLALALSLNAIPSGEFYFYTIIAVVLFGICAFLLKEMKRRMPHDLPLPHTE